MLLNQKTETVMLSGVSKEELGRMIAELVRDNRDVQKALIDIMCCSPNIVTQI